MKVNEVMTTRLVTVEMDDRLPAIKQILSEGSFHHLLVVEDGVLQGVISERDLLRVLSPYLGTDAESVRDIETAQRRAHQVMTHSPITISPSLSIKKALALMVKHDIGCLPVLEADKMIGVFTIHDGVRALIE